MPDYPNYADQLGALGKDFPIVYAFKTSRPAAETQQALTRILATEPRVFMMGSSKSYENVLFVGATSQEDMDWFIEAAKLFPAVLPG